MAKRKVIIELRYTRDRARTFAAAAEAATAPLAVAQLPAISGLDYDPDFVPVEIPGMVAMEGGEEPVEEFARMEIDTRPESATYLVRGEVEDEVQSRAMEAAATGDEVVGVFADVAIETTITCIGSSAVGTHQDVERLLDVPWLRRFGMDGRGVAVAIVDTGVNLAYLQAHGKNPALDPMRSWVPRSGLVPGQLPIGHGTMCAFDACIAAPRCTLLDIAVLLSQQQGGTVMEGLLSDAVRAYAHLIRVALAEVGPGRRYRGLVVNNSWGMFHPSWDYPPGHPGNYSHNPNHPFNRIVGTLERSGADILFAAGNCGRECPDGRCQGLTTGGIFGANAHPQVTCVAGADTMRNRVGYSTSGPGRLYRFKPDVTGYTHFAGSGVYPQDGGTSAATPVVTGLVAAVRTRRPFIRANPFTLPATLRRVLRRTALDRGTQGYDFDYGYGIVRGLPFARGLTRLTAVEEVQEMEEVEGIGGGAEEGQPELEPSTELTATLQPELTAAAGAVRTAFLRIAPDAAPGTNTLTINGFPAGTRSVSAWMTEWSLPNNPHAGGARFDTMSVQLYQNGTKCRIVFRSSWNTHLPAAVQLIYA